MRINQAIAKSGFCSRRKADELIKEGRVKINGHILKEPGYIIQEGDVVKINNKAVPNPFKQDKKYFIFHKPKNCLCTNSDTKDRKTYLSFFDKIDKNSHLFTVGRLDMNTTGLIVVTNDGELANQLLHPKHHVEKEYLVHVNGILSIQQLQKFAGGLKLFNGQVTRPCQIELVKKKYKPNAKKYEGIYRIILKEGKKRQIRFSFKTLGFFVNDLERVRFASLTLKGLALGQYRNLTKSEIEDLLKNKN